MNRVINHLESRLRKLRSERSFDPSYHPSRTDIKEVIEKANADLDEEIVETEKALKTLKAAKG